MADPNDLGRPAPLSAENWQLDAEPELPAADEPPPASPERPVPPAAPSSHAPPAAPTPAEPPPSPLQIIEAMLFVGGPPLTAEKACSAVRGLTPEQFRELADELARKYRRQNRPYAVVARQDGYVLAVKPAFRDLREKLYGGPREARLSQPALDTLSLIAYRQPLTKPEVDSLRGADSAAILRQLVRLGLIAVTRGDADQKSVRYGTTPRFLELFGLASLDDMPRLSDNS